MAEAILSCLAEEVLKNLGSSALNEIAAAWGFKARLEKLKNTINCLKDVLLDAEQRQADSHAIRGWLMRLSSVVHAADDLFDEFSTVASQRQLLGGNKLYREVRTFFSCPNQITFPFRISRNIETIRQELDDIVKDGTQFSFVHFSPEERGLLSKRRDQTYSFVDAEEVVGRDGDKKSILDMLLTPTEREHEVLSVIPIVGIGGLGKTTLAQLLYNDPQIEEHFELRLWVCVSDVFDIKGITEKILMSVTSTEIQKLEMEQLQGQLRKELGDKKYLLVLDDVWNENREEWLKLRALLKIGRTGSKILVTTRSKEVANIMGTVPLYELQGLSDEKAWDLFLKMAFDHGEAQQKPHLIEVGKEIVKKCANVPLAIRSLGSLLYGRDESKWLLLKDTTLAKIPENGSEIMNILKLSYDNLWSPLKNCLGYCALFPKDYEFDTETLIDLWMAEGFIIPTDSESQNLKQLGEGYFQTLLQRCFFQDISRDEWGAIKSCKMHDLIHDLAVEVAGVNCKLVKLGERNVNNKVYHVSFDYRLNSQWKLPNIMLNLKLLRTFLLPSQLKDGSPFSKSICQKLIKGFSRLRVLDLHNLGIQTLPGSIGELIHLRYLDLSRTPIKELPDSTTKLQNLQTLKLYGCLRLRRLPTDISRLANLRSLDVANCLSLIYMPPGMRELTSLHKLPQFTVNLEHIGGMPISAKLSDLKKLNGLRGVLWIDILGKLKDPLIDAKEANFTGKHGLTEFRIELAKSKKDYDDVSGDDHDEAVLEGLKPHPNLKKLEIYWYRGQKLPSWAMMGNLCTNLPNLVEVVLLRCGRCQQVPSFAELPFLKRLCLVSLQSVEYMEMGSSWHDLSSSSESPSTETPFFSSLQELTLMDMDNLKGWWKEVGQHSDDDTKQASHQSVKRRLLPMSFSNLTNLRIEGCPNLISMPLCPRVRELTLVDADRNLTLSNMSAASSSTLSSGSRPNLKKLTIGNVEDLISLPKECLHQLTSLSVQDRKLLNTDRLAEVFTSLSSSLRSLEFVHCESLKSISVGLERLTALEKLVLWNSKELVVPPNERPEDGNMPWESFKSSLRSLQFHMIPKFNSLPSGLQHLTNLRSLEIRWGEELTELPEWISSLQSLEYMELRSCHKLICLPEGFCELSSLKELRIEDCPKLTERCRGPMGKDWPKIQHIPLVVVRKSYLD